MVLTSPRAYNFNCAPQSSQYLYTVNVTLKLRYHKNQKLFSIRVKELFEHVVLLFLKAFSWETDLLVTLCDFTVKKTSKIGKGNPYLTEIRWSWYKMRCAADNHNYMMCKIIFLDLNFNWAVIDKIVIFTKLPEISHIHKNRIFKSIFETFLDQLLHLYKFYGRDMSGILFSFLPAVSC